MDDAAVRHLVRTELRFSHPVEPLLRLQHLALLSAGVDDAVVRHLVGPELRFGHSLKPLLRLVHLVVICAEQFFLPTVAEDRPTLSLYLSL